MDFGYYLKGFITNERIGNEIISRYSNGAVINLYKDLYLIPMIDELYDEINCFERSDAIGKFEMLNLKIQEFIIEISKNGCIDYIEAEYFGGIGGQSAIIYQNEDLIYYEEYGQTAINKVMKCFGVIKESSLDEFDTVGLGRHRFTDDWIEEIT